MQSNLLPSFDAHVGLASNCNDGNNRSSHSMVVANVVVTIVVAVAVAILVAIILVAIVMLAMWVAVVGSSDSSTNRNLATTNNDASDKHWY